MIRLIEALNYRCLRYVRQPLGAFQILVGPNASGKTTLLDVVAFLGDLLENGLEQAVASRTSNFHDLLFNHVGDRFELAAELSIPEPKRKASEGGVPYDTIRYEVAVGLDPDEQEIQILDEQVILSIRPESPPRQPELFPRPPVPVATIMHGKSPGGGQRRVIRKVRDGNDNFYSEVTVRKGKGGWTPSFRLGPRRSALGNMPEDPRNFATAAWMRELLIEGTQKLMLDSMVLRQSSPPGQGLSFRADGANLPWIVENLRKEAPERLRDWVGHVGTALPDLKDIRTVELPDTRHRYLQLEYANGLVVPSWMASDGTLRMLALTLLAYLPDFCGVYLIEEPENGVHPLAMETVYQALRSVYGAQILLATHSPVVLGLADLEDVLCLKKDGTGAADIVCGKDHPALRDWQGETSVSTLYASGVLG